MTDTSLTPEAPDAAQTAHFLRRFADLMSVGHNATYLNHAAVLLDTLTAQVTAAQDEEHLWRYKYETMTHHVDLLEAECDTLKHDIDGHLNIITATLAERDTLAATVEAQKSELTELRRDFDREREKLTVQTVTHDGIVAGLRGAFDGEHARLQAAIDKGAEELAGLRLAFERERDELKAQFKSREAELSELCLASDRQRVELQTQLKAAGDELAAFRVVSGRERDAQIAKIAALEAKRAEIRSAFDRIGELRNQSNEHQDGAGHDAAAQAGLQTEERPLSAQRGEPQSAVGESDAVVPKATLRQARAQFEYLANEFTGVGDVASKVMCELGAFSMDLALDAGRKMDHVPVGEVALSILASPSVTPQPADALTSASNSSP
jgi:chromosome segregation ATPase